MSVTIKTPVSYTHLDVYKRQVMLVVDGKATRVGFKMDGDKKVRVAKATGKTID